jgi:hypothetical protein
MLSPACVGIAPLGAVLVATILFQIVVASPLFWTMVLAVRAFVDGLSGVTKHIPAVNKPAAITPAQFIVAQPTHAAREFVSA